MNQARMIEMVLSLAFAEFFFLKQKRSVLSLAEKKSIDKNQTKISIVEEGGNP